MSAFLELVPYRHDSAEFRDALSGLQSPPDSIPDGHGLLIDLLEHEMRKTVQLRIFGPPFYCFGTSFYMFGLCRGYGKIIRSHCGDFIFFEMDHLICISYHRRNIRRNEMPVITHPYDQRASPSGDDNLTGSLSVNDTKPESTFYLRHGLSDGITETAIEI